MTLSAIGGVIGVAVGLAIAAGVRNVSPLATATPLWSIVVGLRPDGVHLDPPVLRYLPRDEGGHPRPDRGAQVRIGRRLSPPHGAVAGRRKLQRHSHDAARIGVEL